MDLLLSILAIIGSIIAVLTILFFAIAFISVFKLVLWQPICEAITNSHGYTIKQFLKSSHRIASCYCSRVFRHSDNIFIDNKDLYTAKSYAISLLLYEYCISKNYSIEYANLFHEKLIKVQKQLLRDLRLFNKWEFSPESFDSLLGSSFDDQRNALFAFINTYKPNDKGTLTTEIIQKAFIDYLAQENLYDPIKEKVFTEPTQIVSAIEHNFDAISYHKHRLKERPFHFLT